MGPDACHSERSEESSRTCAPLKTPRYLYRTTRKVHDSLYAPTDYERPSSEAQGPSHNLRRLSSHKKLICAPSPSRMRM